MKDRIRLWAIERPVKSISVKEAAKKKRNERSKSHLKTSQNFVLTFQSTLLIYGQQVSQNIVKI
jgi:hypothetical protein